MKLPVTDNIIINEDTLPIVAKLAEKIPGGFFIYHAFGDQELIYFNSNLVSIFGCDNDEEFRELVGNSFKGIVHPDDYAENENTIQNQIKKSSEDFDHVKYRFIRKDGSVGIMDDYGHFSHSKSFGDIYYVFVQDITKEYQNEQRLGQIDILSQTLADYDGVFLIDCINDTRKTFHDKLSGAANYDDAENYSSAFARYVETFVCEPDYETMKGFVEPANILKILGDRTDLTINYRDKTTGTQRFYEMRIIRFSDTEVLQSFRENDAEMVNSLLFNKLKENYHSIFGVDLETGLMRSYKDDPLHVAGEEGEITTFSSTMLNLASHFEGETRAFFERNSDVNFIKERFAKEDKKEYRYKSLFPEGKWTNVTGIVFERKEDGTPSLFCLAFNYLDEESIKLLNVQEKLNEEALRSEVFLDTFNAGKWKYEVSADDEVISASYSDAVHRNTNIATFSGNPMGWLERLHPDDRDQAYEAFMASIYDHSGQTKYDVNFRIIDNDGNIRWTKSAGRVLRREDGSGEYYGMNIDITDEIREQEEHQEQLLKMREHETIAEQFTSNFVKDYDIVYKVSLTDDACTLLKSYEFSDGKESEFSEFSQAIDYVISSLVYEADRNKMLRELNPENVKRELENKKSFSVEYRVLVDGVTRWDKIVISTLDVNTIVVGFIVDSKDILLNHLQEREYENYYALFSIDLDAEQITNIKNESGYGTGAVGSTAPYPVVMEAFANSLEGDAKEFFLHMSDIENVRKIHAVENKLTYAYQSVLDNEKRWIRATSYAVIRHDDGSPAVATLGFNFMDSMSAERHDMAEELARMTVVANYFVKSYSSAYYCDIRNGEVVILHANPVLMERIAGSDVSYKNMLSVYTSEFVHPEDREIVHTGLSGENIRRQLSDAEEFSFTFRVTGQNSPGIYSCTVIRGADENHIGVGFKNITDEIRKEEEAQRIDSLIKTFANEYEAVFIANLNDGSYRTVTNIKEISEIFNGKGSFTKALNRFNAEMMHPADRDRAESERIPLEKTGEGIEVGESHSVEFRCRTEDGYSWYRGTMSRLSEDMLMVGFKDCNDERISQLVEDVIIGEFDALYMVNLDLDEIRPVRASRISSVGKISGKLAYSDLCRRFADTVAPQYREDWIRFSNIDYMKQYMAERDRREYVYELPEAGNAMRRFTVNVVERTDGEAETLLLSFTGIDDARADAIRLHRQLADQTVMLEEALETAQHANRAKTDFLFNMSHDIRTPMNAIIGFTNMAKKHMEDEEKIGECLEKIDTSSHQLLVLINEVLEMSRIESGKSGFKEEPVNVVDEYNTAVTILSKQAKDSGLEFHSSLNDIEHFNVLADSAKINSITLNITGNALKYTPSGGRIDYVLKEVPARKEGYATYVFTVEDTGIGMSEEYQKELFDPFTREQNATISKIQGTGLGMSIVKKYVDILGGNIEVKSAPGKGTRFDITLDFKIDKVAEKSTESVQVSSSVSFEGKRILLVEDNELNRDIATDILEEGGIEVETAEDGTIAVELMEKKGPDYYDFVLMDIQMPIMDGYEATKAIRNMYPDDRIPIVAVSANAFEEDRQASKEAGMDGHVAKPIDISELFGVLANYL